MAEVQVRTGWLAAGGVLLGVSVLVTAFLLGRESARAGAAIPPVVEHSARAQLEPPAPRVEQEAARDPPAPPRPAPQAIAAALAPPPAPADPPVEVQAPAAPQAPEPAAKAGELRAYLDQVARIQAGAVGESPEAYANKLITSAMSGDPSGFRELEQEMAQGLSKLRTMSPPAEAEEYHRLLVASLEKSHGLLAVMKDALVNKDPNALEKLAASAQQIQAAAERLKAEEERLRARSR